MLNKRNSNKKTLNSKLLPLLTATANCFMPRFSAILTSENKTAELGLIKDESGRAGMFKFSHLAAVGEVTLFNSREIRTDLQNKPEMECSDGELLLRLYAEIGTEAFVKACGMFVLAVYDGANLLIARDSIGARPMFFTFYRQTWIASSSLKFIRRCLRENAKLNSAAVRSFLTFAYLPGDETLLENVFELLPAHALRLFAGGKCEKINYYEPCESYHNEKSVSATVRDLRQELEEVTVSQLPKPTENVGVFLSGGIDSSLVTAIVAKNHSSGVHTYSISFGEDLPNENAYSGLVAAHCRTEHRVLSFNGRQISKHLETAVALLDCPVGDPLTVPNLLLSRAAARDGLRVILNGEGGDPCFGGPKNLPMLIWELNRLSNESLAHAYLSSYRKCFDDLVELLAPEFKETLQCAPPLERFVQPFLESPSFGSFLNRLLYANIRTKLAHHILPKVERLTASCGLEGRSPLADQRLVNQSFAIPPQLKLNGTVEKWILKEAVRDLLPATIIDRPKSGMRVPVQHWLQGPLRELGHDLLLGKRAITRGLFQTKTIRDWLNGKGSIYARQGGKLWLLLTLELWLRAFLDDL
jgi:asparagine synthase (glutamine-hydrolysing)